MKEQKTLELYFHIPFCVRKCLYCDFLSAPSDDGTKDAYMEALLREIKERAGEYHNYLIDTVFIGGGTPSAVAPTWIEKLMETVKEHFQISDTSEVTIEVNPGTVNEDALRMYHNVGINRLSIGLQSADDAELARLGRIHTWEEFRETYTLARNAGFSNVNVDVMSALPGQNMDSYKRTLHKVLSLTPQPEHISAYSLIVEEGTPFAKMEEAGTLALPDEDEERLMYEQTKEVLGMQGYERYEISNYAKRGFSCRHNIGYWKRTEYVGFGIGAASLVENVRFRNESDLKKYITDPLSCRCEHQTLNVQEQMEEFMFLGLRMTVGVGKNKFEKIFGQTMDAVYGEVIRRNIADGLLYEYADTEAGETYVALTERGLDLSNYVMSQFLLG